VAVTSKVYGLSMSSMLNKEINFLTDTVKAMLCTSTYVPNQDTHRYKSDVTNEVTGTGYTAGGVTLTTKTAVYSGASNTLTLDSDDPSWSASSLTARFIVFYVSTGTDATSPLIAYADFGADATTVAATFTYQLPATGIAQYIAA
jgi:hypothetical protein